MKHLNVSELRHLQLHRDYKLDDAVVVQAVVQEVMNPAADFVRLRLRDDSCAQDLWATVAPDQPTKGATVDRALLVPGASLTSCGPLVYDQGWERPTELSADYVAITGQGSLYTVGPSRKPT